MKLIFLPFFLLAGAFTCHAATIAFDNFALNGSSEVIGAYGVRDASGSLVTSPGFQGRLGTFTVSNSTIQSSFSANDFAAISSAFTAFNPVAGNFDPDNAAPGAFQALESFTTKASDNSLGGAPIYAVFYDGTTISGATQLFIAQLTNSFPTDPDVGAAATGSAFLTPSGVSSIVVGTTGPSHDYSLGGGALPTYQLATVPEPSRILFLALGGMGLLLRRRRV